MKILLILTATIFHTNFSIFACAEQTQKGLNTIEDIVGDWKYKNYVTKLNSSVCDRLEDHDQNLYYKLLKEEVMGIYSYTTNDVYKELNKSLRSGKNTSKSKYGQFINIINSGLNKLPKYKGTTVRFERKKSVSTWRPGVVKTFKAFTSSSKKKGFCWSGNVKMIIKSKTGRFIGMMSNYPHEQEVLFLPKSQFKVIKKVEATKKSSGSCSDPKTLDIIHLEQIL